MRDALPDFIDPKRQAADTGSLRGVWPAKRCRRTADAVSRFLEDAALELRFTRQTAAEVEIDGRLRMSVELTCQRCLQPMRWTIDEPLRVTAADPPAPDAAEDRREVIELDEQGRIAVGPWIEDEILLRIPLAPKHADSRECDPRMTECTRETDPEQESAENPFSVLKDLK